MKRNVTGWSGFLQRMRVAGLWLALVAFAFKAALPAGYMLGQDDGDRVAIVLCTAQGAASAYLDLDTGQIIEHGVDHEDAEDVAPPCPFALASAPVVTPAPFLISAPASGAFAFNPPARAPPAFVSRAQHLPPPARGPPLQA